MSSNSDSIALTLLDTQPGQQPRPLSPAGDAVLTALRQLPSQGGRRLTANNCRRTLYIAASTIATLGLLFAGGAGLVFQLEKQASLSCREGQTPFSCDPVNFTETGLIECCDHVYGIPTERAAERNNSLTALTGILAAAGALAFSTAVLGCIDRFQNGRPEARREAVRRLVGRINQEVGELEERTYIKNYAINNDLLTEAEAINIDTEAPEAGYQAAVPR